ncbi:MAG: glucosaminidase domain-containing protein, partial [Lachnospiraceae bacterium]|nr:glucosaminidase domain-containing protein [Lachnospiraceae bacterium]
YKNTDAPTIDAFVQIYIEECAAEGVRADIAFAQAMNETGYLRFGGLVHIEDLNFAGMGATDSPNDRNIAQFTSVRMGVRAQIQHLKAYACTDAIKNPIVDPRFKLVTRGCAPYLEWLSIPNNPYGKGWASDENYAGTINGIIAKIKAQ